MAVPPCSEGPGAFSVIFISSIDRNLGLCFSFNSILRYINCTHNIFIQIDMIFKYMCRFGFPGTCLA